MNYMLLIYTDPTTSPETGTPEQKTMSEDYFTLTTELRESGKLIAGDALQGIETATSVSVRNGKVLTTDGPFAETNEVLGGFYLVDAADLDEAIAWAAKIPGAEFGTIEVRPVMNLPY